MPEFLTTIKKKLLFGLVSSVFFFNFSGLYGQTGPPMNQRHSNDTIIIEAQEQEEVIDTSFHDPKKAVLYSALLPGLGQIYNKKIWKVPIIYAGFGTLGYFIDRNNKYYNDLRSKLKDPDYELKYFEVTNITEDQLITGKEYYQRWRDLSIISTVGFYLLQLVDASVDAHMFDWDVSTDLSIHIEPTGIYTPLSPFNSLGMRASISF